MSVDTSAAWGDLASLGDPPIVDRFSELTLQSGALQSIVQLGFALTLGILLDTFIVRPVLLPAFLGLQARWASRRKTR